MFQPTHDQMAKLEKLNATYSFVRKTFADKPNLSGIYCEIYDLATGGEKTFTPYAYGRGDTEAEALKNALHRASCSTKPMTQSQLADPVLAEKIRKLTEQHYADKIDEPPDEDEGEDDPQPEDRRTKAWRDWKARQSRVSAKE